MTISTHVTTAVLSPAGTVLDLREGQVALDESWAPYGRATLLLGIPASSATLDALDPRPGTAPRVVITATVTYDPSTPAATVTRTFDLGIRTRTIDHEAGTVTLTLATDEAKLQDDVLRATTADLTAYNYQSSLRALVNNVVLSRIGATLAAGDPDVAVPVFIPDTTNTVVNTSAWVDLTGVSSIGLTNLVRQVASGKGWPYNTAFRLNGGNASDSWMIVSGMALGTGALQAGKRYRASALFTSDAVMTGAEIPGRSRRIVLFRRRNGEAGYTEFASPAAVNTTGTQQLVLDFDLPSDTVEAFIRLYHGHASLAVCYYTGIRVSEWNPDITDVKQFDGGGSNGGPTTGYTFAWTGTAGVSSSTRKLTGAAATADALTWAPGKSAWDFIQPIFQAAGMRLFCDERRRWRLVKGQEFVADGHLQLAYGQQLSTVTDTVTRDGDAEWWDAALVRYRWNDSTGVAQERYDAYAEPGATKTRVMDLAAPYPGPGFAEYLVRRALGRGRTLDLGAVSQLSVSPSQPVTVTVPSAPIQVGLVSRVTFDLDTGGMTVGTRGLTDTTPDAWLFGPATTDWSALPTDMDWSAFAW